MRANTGKSGQTGKPQQSEKPEQTRKAELSAREVDELGAFRALDLKFKDPRLEYRFVRDFFDRNIRRTRAALALSFMVLVIYALLDPAVLQVPEVAARVRVLFAIPIVATALVCSFTVRHYLFYLVLTIFAVLVLVNQILLVYLVGPEIITFATMAFLQITLFTAVLFLIPFTYVFWSCLITTGLMIYGLQQVGGGGELVVNYQVALVGVVFASIAFSYSRERNLRELFWQETELRRLRVQSEKQQAKQVAWLRNLSRYLEHELRNHVFAVQSNLEILRETRTNDAQSRARIDISFQALKKLGDLCDAVSEASALESALELDRTRPVNLSRLVSQRVLARSRVIEETNPIELDIEEDLWVEANAQRLVQMFDILLTNALQHSSADAHVRLSMRCIARRVFFTIHNHGDPLPLGKDIFEMFESTRPDTNLGIGLNVAKKIVEHQRGTIEARSHEDETIFMVTLPQIDAPPQQASQASGEVLRFNRPSKP